MAPGRVVFTGSRRVEAEEEGQIRDGYISLSADGSAFAAIPVDGEGAGQVGENTLVDTTIVNVELVTSWAAYRAGEWGSAHLVAGIIDADTPDGAPGSELTLVNADSGRVRKAARTRTISGYAPSTMLPIDLGAVQTLQQRLSAAHIMLCGLFQEFGIAEPPRLLPDGTLIEWEYSSSWHSTVRGWAQSNGVPSLPHRPR